MACKHWAFAKSSDESRWILRLKGCIIKDSEVRATMSVKSDILLITKSIKRKGHNYAYHLASFIKSLTLARIPGRPHSRVKLDRRAHELVGWRFPHSATSPMRCESRAKANGRLFYRADGLSKINFTLIYIYHARTCSGEWSQSIDEWHAHPGLKTSKASDTVTPPRR